MSIRMFQTALSIGLILLIAGCATSSGLAPLTSYDPGIDARIGYRANGYDSFWLFPDQTCSQVDVPRHLLGMSMMPDTTTAYNLTLSEKTDFGMPKPVMSRGGSFRQFVVKGGQPLTIMGKLVMTYISPDPAYDTADACGPVFTTFIPVAGHDYEVYMGQGQPGKPIIVSCKLFVHELRTVNDPNTGVSIVKSIPVAPASGVDQCTAPNGGEAR